MIFYILSPFAKNIEIQEYALKEGSAKKDTLKNADIGVEGSVGEKTRVFIYTRLRTSIK